MSSIPDLVRQTDLCAMLGLERSQVKRLEKAGVITPIREGHRKPVWYSHADLLKVAELRQKKAI